MTFTRRELLAAANAAARWPTGLLAMYDAPYRGKLRIPSRAWFLKHGDPVVVISVMRHHFWLEYVYRRLSKMLRVPRFNDYLIRDPQRCAARLRLLAEEAERC